MNYQKYKQAKEYVKYWELECAKIQRERIKIKNPVLTLENYLYTIALRLYNAQKEYSDILFLYNHHADFKIYEDYLLECRTKVFQLIKLKHDYKKSLK